MSLRHAPQRSRVLQSMAPYCHPNENTVEKQQKDRISKDNRGFDSTIEPTGKNVSCTYIVRLTDTLSRCKICDLVLSGGQTVHSHIAGRNHAVSLKKYGCENIILEQDGTYRCGCCESFLSNVKEVYEHIKGRKHSHIVLQNQSNGNESIQAPVIPANTVDSTVTCRLVTKLDKNVSSCEVCSITLCSARDILEHLAGKRHRAALTNYDWKKISLQDGNAGRNPCSCRNCKISSPEHPSSLGSSGKQQNPLGMQLSIKKQTILLNAVDQTVTMPCNFIEKVNGGASQCKICNLKLSGSKPIDDHLAGKTHGMALSKFGCNNISIKNGEYYCSCCRCKLSGEESVYLHIKGKRHSESLNTSNEQKPQQPPIQRKIQTIQTPKILQNSVKKKMPCNFIVKLNGGASHCEICNLKLSGSKPIDDHLSGKTHRMALLKFGCNNISIKNRDYYCSCCRCKLPGEESVYLHIKGKRHSESLSRPDKQQFNAFKKIASVASNIENPESKTTRLLISSIATSAAGISKLLGEMEITETRAQTTHKRRTNAPKIQTICSICGASLPNEAKLHIHLARHIGKELHPPDQSTSNDRKTSVVSSKIAENKLGSSSENPESSSTLGSADGTSEESQRKLATHDKNMNDLGGKSESGGTKRLDSSSARSSDDENISPSESSTLGLDAETDNPVEKLKTEERPDSDDMYAMSVKWSAIELGIKLSLVVDSRKMYCLICQKMIANKLEDYYEHLSSLEHWEYLDEMEQDHALFERFPEQFSSLDLACCYMEEISDESARCLVCNEEMNNTENSLKNHTKTDKHEQLCKEMHASAKRNLEDIKSRRRCDWYSVKEYWCVPCSTKMGSEASFVKHLEGKNHAKTGKHSEKPEHRLMFDCCPSCALLWYGPRSTYATHCEDPLHDWLKRDGFYSSRDLPEMAKNLVATAKEYIEKKITRLEEESVGERGKERKLLSNLKRAVEQKFKKAEVHPFGSRMTGLRSTDSDIDVFLDCGNMYNGRNVPKHRIMRIMTDVEKCLSGSPHSSWVIKEVLPHCRAPLLKVWHSETGLQCDISFKNGLSVENTKLIKSFNDTFPKCRQMILILKEWLVLCELSGSDRITNYALYWLVIFYLQKESILPSIVTLIAMNTKSRIIAGWEVGVTHNFTYNEAECSFTIEDLLERFFKFYASFDYRYDVACPLIGDIVRKEAFAKNRNLPAGMAPYIAYMKKSGDAEGFRSNSSVCVQDPFDLSHNITKAVNQVILNRFRIYCSKSLDAIYSSKYP